MAAAKEKKLAAALYLNVYNFCCFRENSLEICQYREYDYIRQKFGFRQFYNNGGQQND